MEIVSQIYFKKIMKKIITIIILLFSLTSYSQDLKHNPNSYIDDFAGILNDETKNYLQKNIVAFKDTAEVEFSIVTVKSLNGQDIETFTLNLARKWGVGSKANQGVMILIAPNERKIRTEVGYGLEFEMPDIWVTNEQNKITKYFKENDYNTGIKKLLDSYLERLSPTAIEQRKIAEEKKLEILKNKISTFGQWVLNFLLFLAVFASIFFAIYFIIKKIKTKREEKLRKIEEERIRLENNEKKRKRKIKEFYDFIHNFNVELEEVKNSILIINDNKLPATKIIPEDIKNETLENVEEIFNKYQSDLKEYKQNLGFYKNYIDTYKAIKNYNSETDDIKENFLQYLEEIKTGLTKTNSIKGLNIIVFDLNPIIKEIATIKTIDLIHKKYTVGELDAIGQQYLNLSSTITSIEDKLNDVNLKITNKIQFKNKVDANVKSFPSIIQLLITTINQSAFMNDKKGITKELSDILMKFKKSIYGLESYYDINAQYQLYFGEYESILNAYNKAESEYLLEIKRKEMKEAEKRQRNSYSSSYYSSSYNNSSSYNSSSDSSFGGGSFGGGGGTSSW